MHEGPDRGTNACDGCYKAASGGSGRDTPRLVQWARPGDRREHHHELVSLTARAAAKIRELMAEEPDGEVAVLRVAVQGGGCSGFQYALGFDRGAQEGDHELELHGVKRRRRPVQRAVPAGRERSTSSTALQESGFKIDNPNVVVRLRLRPLLPGRRGRRARRAVGGCGSGCCALAP